MMRNVHQRLHSEERTSRTVLIVAGNDSLSKAFVVRYPRRTVGDGLFSITVLYNGYRIAPKPRDDLCDHRLLADSAQVSHGFVQKH
jgi:hypothetical protein